MKRFMLALRFLTIFPFGKDHDVTDDDLAASSYYYPVVGAILGLILYWTWTFAKATWPVFLASALTVTLWAVLTAGLHLDGLMDTFDGLGVRGDRERRLEVMRDSRVGAFGAQAAIFAIFLKIAAVSALGAKPAMATALILAPSVGRTAMVALMGTGNYARSGAGLARSFVAGTGKSHVVLTLLLLLILGFAAMGTILLPILLSQFLVFLILRWFFETNFGGITGDLLGAACEIQELSFMILIHLFL